MNQIKNRGVYNNKNPRNPRYDWRTIFLKNRGGFSSKRILSIIGFLTCVGLLIAAFILDKEVPEFAETMLICCISLYGVDAIPNFWTKSINKS